MRIIDEGEDEWCATGEHILLSSSTQVYRVAYIHAQDTLALRDMKGERVNDDIAFRHFGRGESDITRKERMCMVVSLLGLQYPAMPESGRCVSGPYLERTTLVARYYAEVWFFLMILEGYSREEMRPSKERNAYGVGPEGGGLTMAHAVVERGGR